MKKDLIINWARERKLLSPNNAEKQLLKAVEELGELAQSVLKNDKEGIKDAIGDLYVVFTIYAEQVGSIFYYDEFKPIKKRSVNYYIFEISESIVYLDKAYDSEWWLKHILRSLNTIAVKSGLTLEDCVNQAWNEIKDRQGRTINGTFIKD